MCGKFSFSLRTLFILMTLCTGIVALKTSSVARQRAAIRAIENHVGGNYRFDYVYDLDRQLDDPKTATQVAAALKAGKISYPPPPPGPAWVRRR